MANGKNIANHMITAHQESMCMVIVVNKKDDSIVRITFLDLAPKLRKYSGKKKERKKNQVRMIVSKWIWILYPNLQAWVSVAAKVTTVKWNIETYQSKKEYSEWHNLLN